MSAVNVVKKFFPEVTHVVDAKRGAIIEVSAKDANPKAQKNHEGCALAVACKKKFNLDGVIISRGTAYLIKGKRARRFKLPEGTSREIVSFDRGSGFSPGVYNLSPIPKSAELGARSHGKNGAKTNKEKAEKKFRHMTSGIRTVLGGQKPDEA